MTNANNPADELANELVDELVDDFILTGYSVEAMAQFCTHTQKR